MLSRLAWLLDGINLRNLCFLYFLVAPFLLDRKNISALLVLFAVGYLITALLFFLALSARLANPIHVVRYSNYTVPIMAVLVIILLSSLVANPSGLVSPSLLFTKYGKVLLPALAFFVMINVLDSRDLSRLYGLLLVIGVVSIVVGFGEAVSSAAGGALTTHRIGDLLFGDPNKYSVLLNIFYAMVFSSLLSRLKSGRPYAAQGVGVFTVIVSIFLTQSRSGILTFVLVTIVCLWATRSRKIILNAILIFIPVILLFAVAIAMRYLDGQTAMHSDLGRVWTYIVAWNAIQDNVMFGVGFGNTVGMYDQYGKIYEAMLGTPLDVHNAMLETFAQQGVLGFICYLSLVFVPIVALGRRIKANPSERYPAVEVAALSIPLCFFTYGLFYHQYITNEHFWTLMAFTVIVLKAGDEASGELTARLPKWI